MKFEFDGSELSQKRFEILYVGFLVGGSSSMAKGMTTIRREMSILEKLESISEPFPCGKKIPGYDEEHRKLSEGERSFELDEKEFDILHRYVTEMTPWSAGKSTRLIIDVDDWMREIQARG